MTHGEAGTVNSHMPGNWDEARTMLLSLDMDGLMTKCSGCQHRYGEHSRGTNGPCVATAACRCLGFDMNLVPPGVSYRVDGYWE